MVPKTTWRPSKKLSPTMITVDPPVVHPSLGLMALMQGVAANGTAHGNTETLSCRAAVHVTGSNSECENDRMAALSARRLIAHLLRSTGDASDAEDDGSGGANQSGQLFQPVVRDKAPLSEPNRIFSREIRPPSEGGNYARGCVAALSPVAASA